MPGGLAAGKARAGCLWDGRCESEGSSCYRIIILHIGVLSDYLKPGVPRLEGEGSAIGVGQVEYRIGGGSIPCDFINLPVTKGIGFSATAEQNIHDFAVTRLVRIIMRS